MKRTLLISAFLLIVIFSFSQELLYFTNGNMLKIANSKQSLDSVSFTIYSSSPDRYYSINKNELVKLISEEGNIIEFSGKYNIGVNNDFSTNIVSFNVLDVPMGRFTMLYQFINKTGKVGYEIPISVGLAPNAYMDPHPEIFDIEFYSLFYSGITINLYPMGQRKVNYVMGPSFRIGFGQEDYWDQYNYTNINHQGYYSKLLINNGLVLNPNKHFSMSFIFSLGVMHRNSPDYIDNFGTVADLAFILSYRF